MRCFLRRFLRFPLPLLIVALLGAGCGHKGPLYLPGQKPGTTPAQPATTPSGSVTPPVQ